MASFRARVMARVRDRVRTSLELGQKLELGLGQ